MKKILLTCAFTFVVAIAYGQTELPRTREVPGFRPGMTITQYLDPVTGRYHEERNPRTNRDRGIAHPSDSNKKATQTTRNSDIATHRVRYQGELNTLYVLGTGTRAYNIVGVETVHGVRINPYLFCGVGVGLNYYYKSKEREYDFVGAKFIPVFIDLKYYFFNTKVSPYLKIDAGYGINSASSARMYFSPSIGVKCSVASTMSVNFDIGYQGQMVSEAGRSDVLDGVAFRVGWSF